MVKDVNEKRVVVVLGMHRSGTSLLARMLMLLGVELGQKILPADENNQAGYWEQSEIVRVQEEILEKIGRRWIGPRGALPYPDHWWLSPAIGPLKRRLREIVQTEIQLATGVWGFKDPRTSRLLPLWDEIFQELSIEPDYLLAVRDPRAVVASVVQRDQISPARAELLWLMHNLDAFRDAGQNLRGVIDYDLWFNDPVHQFRSMVKGLGFAWSGDEQELVVRIQEIVRPDLRHHQESSYALSAYASELYGLLTQAAREARIPEGLEQFEIRARQAAQAFQAWAEVAESAASEQKYIHHRANPPENLPIPNVVKAGYRSAKVCIASSDLVGPIRNGGIGTAYSSLAEGLAKSGHQVTLLYLLGEHCENGSIQDWISYYKEKNIKLIPLVSDVPLVTENLPYATISYRAYIWLKERKFDIVHFPEWGGHAYYSVVAKHQGLGFENTLICVGTHSPSFWHREGNFEYLSRLEELDIDFMERESVRLADIVISPSRYMLDWMVEQGWQLPDKSYIQQNILPFSARNTGGRNGQNYQSIKEVVFFGRQESRKGLELFCNAIDNLVQFGAPDTQITFLGKPGIVSGQNSLEYIQARAAKWPWNWHIISDYDQKRAIGYLKEKNRLAVICSLVENSPYTVLECLGGQVPLLASKVGGIPELIAEVDLERTCFPLNEKILAGKILRALQEGHAPSRPAVDPDENERVWIAWHASLVNEKKKAARPRGLKIREQQPKVSVCITHFNRPIYLKQALDSIKAQDYSNFEVILVDDGSTHPEAIAYLDKLEPEFKKRGWSIVRQENRYLGAARNHAAQLASGEYLLFMDDDNVAKPHELSTFVSVAQKTGADILTCASSMFRGDGSPVHHRQSDVQWIPIGGLASTGAFRNCFGDANALIRRDTFNSLGGFTEDYGVGHEDWEFFSNAVLNGYHLETIPEALFWYRVNPDSMLRSTQQYKNHRRNIRPYLEAVPYNLRYLVLYAQGLSMRANWLESTTVMLQKMVGAKAKLEAGRALCNTGHLQNAENFLHEALQEARATHQAPIALEVFIGVAGVFLQMGKLDHARKVLLDAERIALQSRNQQGLLQVNSMIERVEQLKRRVNEKTVVYSSSRVENRHGKDPACTLQLLLEATDLQRALEELESELDSELVALIRLNAETARADGDQELAEGLDGLADYVQAAIGGRMDLLPVQQSAACD